MIFFLNHGKYVFNEGKVWAEEREMAQPLKARLASKMKTRSLVWNLAICSYSEGSCGRSELRPLWLQYNQLPSCVHLTYLVVGNMSLIVMFLMLRT